MTESGRPVFWSSAFRLLGEESDTEMNWEFGIRSQVYRLRVVATVRSLGLRCLLEQKGRLRLGKMVGGLRFSRPKNLRSEGQLETFPYPFQGIVLARYSRFLIIEDNISNATGATPRML